jgi:hypothetical protein
MNSQAPIINVSGDYEETILRLAKHLGKDKNRRAVFNLIYGRGSKPRSKKQIAEAIGKAGSGQVIQNALDDLAKHHLIVRVENKGQVKDGSRWLYAKENSVRANRDRILRYADDPGAAKKVATKRRPSMDLVPCFVSRVPAAPRSNRTSRARPSPAGRTRIALLVTNPDRNASLQTAIEARDIETAIKVGGRPDKVDLKMFLAPTFDTLVDALNGYRPDVLHFSGHGGGRELLFDNEKAGTDGGTALDFDMVARLIGMTSYKPKLLVLAACDTADGAARFLDAVPAVIAMTNSIDDEAACEFSARFYQSLTAGASIRNSLGQAKAKLEHKGYRDADLPALLTKSDADANRTLI